MDDGSGPRGPRDNTQGAFDMSESIYGTLPSRATTMPALSDRARAQDVKSRKRTPNSDDFFHPSISLNRYTARKRSRLHDQKSLQVEMHASTCLNLSSDNADPSDLWILPDFDEWELDAESAPVQQETQRKRESEWAPLVQRAVNSNRERLRRRLEGDGWDFVGGKYGDDGKALSELKALQELDSASESVDEEFDVVVLPEVHVSC